MDIFEGDVVVVVVVVVAVVVIVVVVVGGSAGGSGGGCGVVICPSFLLQKGVNAFSADIHLLCCGFRGPVGIGFANDDVSFVWGPRWVELENDAMDRHSEVIGVANLVVLPEILECHFLKSIWRGLLVALEVFNGSPNTLGYQREKILLSTY